MTADVFDFESYYREKLKKSLITVTEDDWNEFKKQLEQHLKQDKEHIEWATYNLYRRRYTLFLNCLFHNNREVSKYSIHLSGFIVGFKEEHFDYLENKVCQALSFIGRQYRIINTKNKTALKIEEEILGRYLPSKRESHKELHDFFNKTEQVIILKELSKSKVDYKEGYIRFLAKILGDSKRKGVYLTSDLIFLDYASFLQRIWNLVGFYLSIITYSENETETSFS